MSFSHFISREKTKMEEEQEALFICRETGYISFFSLLLFPLSLSLSLSFSALI